MDVYCCLTCSVSRESRVERTDARARLLARPESYADRTPDRTRTRAECAVAWMAVLLMVVLSSICEIETTLGACLRVHSSSSMAFAALTFALGSAFAFASACARLTAIEIKSTRQQVDFASQQLPPQQPPQ